MGDTTAGIVTNAGAWEYLYDLVVARRVITGQSPLQFPHQRRIRLLATAGAVQYCKDPINNPPGIEVSAIAADPTTVESGSRMNNESLRNYYVKGGGTLEVDCDY